MYTSNQEKGTQETSKESQTRSCCEMQHDARKEDAEKKALNGIACQKANSLQTVKKGIKNFNDVVASKTPQGRSATFGGSRGLGFFPFFIFHVDLNCCTISFHISFFFF